MKQELTNQIVDKNSTKDIDLKGRKVINAALATSPTDYVTLQQVEDLIQILINRNGLL